MYYIYNIRLRIAGDNHNDDNLFDSSWNTLSELPPHLQPTDDFPVMIPDCKHHNSQNPKCNLWIFVCLL